MANDKKQAAPAAKQDANATGDGASNGADVTLNTGATQPPAENAASDAKALDATLADVGEAAETVERKAASTLSEHVAQTLASVEKQGDTAGHSLLNVIHVKLADLRNTVLAFEKHVVDAASDEAKELIADIKRFF